MWRLRLELKHYYEVLCCCRSFTIIIEDLRRETHRVQNQLLLHSFVCEKQNEQTHKKSSGGWPEGTLGPDNSQEPQYLRKATTVRSGVLMGILCK
jgi:hypothetical protein